MQAVDIDRAEQDIRPRLVVLIGLVFNRQLPVRRLVIGIEQQDAGVVEIEEFDEDRPVEERPEVNTHLRPAHRDHVFHTGPIGVCEVHVFGDDCRAPRQIDVEFTANLELSTEFVRYQSLDLRLEYTEVGRPEPA